MKIPQHIPLYGDSAYRGKCPKEDAEHKAIFRWMKLQHPKYHAVMIHPKNEGKRRPGQYQYDKSMGLNKGASDVIIPGNPSFICELKRKNPSLCTISVDQIKYLEACEANGCFACVALGFEGFVEAFNAYLVRPHAD